MKRGNKSFKVIIDSNIWISFLIGKNLKGLQNHIDSQKLEIVTCTDPKDNYLVSLAIASNAKYLITGDNDLLDLRKIGETLVLKYSDFERIFD